MAAPHWLRQQLSGPEGWLARPMAHLLNRFNGKDYKLALAQLGANSGETVLELGFGGGVGVESLLNQGALVYAAEPSVAMRERAFRRWARPLAEGKLEVWSNSAEELPQRDVDRALSMNTVYFWQDIEAGFANLSRIVKKRVVFGIAPKSHLVGAGFEKEGYRLEELSWYQSRLEAVGFQCATIEPPGDGRCALLIGDKPS